MSTSVSPTDALAAAGGPLTLAEIERAHALLSDRVVRTPSVPWVGSDLASMLAPGTRVTAKLELLQKTGSFKARGALLNVLGLGPEQRAHGITAISAGNHAVAAAYAAAEAGVSAKVVMIATANPRRVELAKRYGAEVVFAENAHVGFALVEKIAHDEGRTLIHPFEGRTTAMGTSTLGFEFMSQVPGLDAVIVPIGGGGLCAGVSSAVKAMNPGCLVLGVEPEGADSMTRSFATGEPQGIDAVRTIADSLGAPYALPVTFEMCRRNVDKIVLVSDDALRAAMRMTLLDMKLAVEPAGAAALAALVGPLRDELAGAHVGLIVCGANIDVATYARLITE